MNGNVYTDKSGEEDISHEAISSWFLGPRAENLQYLKENVLAILDGQAAARSNYADKYEDGVLSFTFLVFS